MKSEIITRVSCCAILKTLRSVKVIWTLTAVLKRQQSLTVTTEHFNFSSTFYSLIILHHIWNFFTHLPHLYLRSELGNNMVKNNFCYFSRAKRTVLEWHVKTRVVIVNEGTNMCDTHYTTMDDAIRVFDINLHDEVSHLALGGMVLVFDHMSPQFQIT